MNKKQEEKRNHGSRLIKTSYMKLSYLHCETMLSVFKKIFLDLQNTRRELESIKSDKTLQKGLANSN